MIGVIANPEDRLIALEFFELFKTPWEFYRRGQPYDVVLCAGNMAADALTSPIVLLYAGGKTAIDAESKVPIESKPRGTVVTYAGSPLPIYGAAISFAHARLSILEDEQSHDSVAYFERRGKQIFARIGYDLFREVDILLGKGQHSTNAGIPSLDLHIAFLRNLITSCGVPLVEIPPVPDQYPFIACLTHDVDHASIRCHKFDHTMFGFLYRATVGSVIETVRGRLPMKKLIVNLAAAAKLPLVHLGLSKDFWFEFDRYVELEQGRPSTFFVIPFSRTPGSSSASFKREAPHARGSKYDISQISDKIQSLIAAGCEIGLHGIDAWCEGSKGREEAKKILEVFPTTELGVRMHWLYRDASTAGVLEDAGFAYDSTVGYNETVGYRAGTSQVFKPLHAMRLLELPMHVMDTALFYPSYLNLSPADAWSHLRPFLDHANGNGGVFTVNWHDRSIAPERLWGDFYSRLLEELSARGAWFSTANQVVSWFRKRRSAVFENVSYKNGRLCANISCDEAPGLPRLRLRFHPARSQESTGMKRACQEGYIDTGFNGSVDVQYQTGRSVTIRLEATPLTKEGSCK